MITESILKKFRSSIISESIHLPHGTRSAKIVCHTDLDGVGSGISMVSQLVKQGIPRNRITVEFAQYGDEEKQKDKFTDKFEGRKGEYVGVTDFAKFPKAKPFEIFNQLMGFKGDKKEFVDFMKSRDFSKMTSNEFSELFIEKFKPEQNKFTNGSIGLNEVMRVDSNGDLSRFTNIFYSGGLAIFATVVILNLVYLSKGLSFSFT